MSKKDSALGKGLSAIFGNEIESVLEDIQHGKTEEYQDMKTEIPLNQIKTNPYQPRKHFNDDKIQELSQSIQQHGVFTPILVKKSIQGYQLIAGERRLRASKLANLDKIPAIVMEFTDQQMMEIALLENIQRENLNAIEEAQGYEKLLKNIGYTQEELAQRIGKSRVHIANLLRLLKLPPSIQNYVSTKQLSMGHVRALLPLKDENLMEQIAEKAIESNLSVRAVENLVKKLLEPKEQKSEHIKDVQLQALENRLQQKFQTKIKVSDSKITISYANTNDLNRILEMLDCLEDSLA